MGSRWEMERKKDPYYRRAKSEDYRSRASYKLKQLNNIIQHEVDLERKIDLIKKELDEIGFFQHCNIFWMKNRLSVIETTNSLTC